MKCIGMGMGNFLYLKEILVSEFERRLKESGNHIYPSHVRLIYETVSSISHVRKTYSIQGSFGGKKTKHRDIKSA